MKVVYGMVGLFQRCPEGQRCSVSTHSYHSLIHTQPVCLAPQSIHCLANSHRSHKPLFPAFPSTQSLPLDSHSLLHELSRHYCLSCSPSTQPVSYPRPMQEGNHPPSLQPRISVPGCFNTRSRFLVSLSTKPLPATTPQSQSQVPLLSRLLALSLCP